MNLASTTLLAPCLAKKHVSRVEQLRVGPKRRQAGDSGLVTVTKPVADAVTRYRATNCACEHPSKTQGPSSHKRTGDKYRRATRDNGTYNGDGFEERSEEDHRKRPRWMPSEQMQHVEIRVLHLHLPHSCAI